MPAYIAVAYLTGQKLSFFQQVFGWRSDSCTLIASSLHEAIGITYEKARTLGPELTDNRQVDTGVIEISHERLRELLEHARPQSEIDAELAAKSAMSETGSG